ncbi:MAG: transposase family protein [Oceanospirillales bacterium]|nr:transposase family protein [Oceanospirillales bacterium]
MTSLNLETFKKEQEILFFDAKATARLSKNGKFLTIDFADEDRQPVTLSEEDFTRYVGKKILPLAKVTEAQLRMPLTLEQQENILRGERTVEAMIAAGPGPGGKKHRERICKAVATKYGYNDPTPPKTAYNWYIAHHSIGLYAYFTSRQHTRHSKSRFDEKVVEMAYDLLSDTMFNPALLKINLSTVHRLLVRRIKRLDPSLAIPSYETLRSWFLDLEPFAVKQAKEGHVSLRKARAQNVTAQYCFFRPLQRVEADAMYVTLNIVDKDGKKVAKRIVIYFLIDCFSRSILGFHLQVGGSENEEGVIQSIRNAILMKDHDNWIQHGLPSQIVVDGGPAYRSLTTQSELLSLGISTRIVATGAGYRKPFVERFIRTCRDLFFSTLPGYLGKQDDQKRVSLLIEESVPYTADEIKEKLTTWITESYHQRRHLGLYRSTPLTVWRQGIIDYPVPHIENHESADIWLGKMVEHTISGENCHQGVQVETIKYNDREGQLQRIGIALKNKHKGTKAKVKCYWNELDISSITVIDPFTEQAFRVKATTQHVKPGMSKDEFDELIAQLYPTPPNTDDDPTTELDFLDDPDYVEKLKSQTKCIKRQQHSRAAPAKENDLASAVAERLSGTNNATLPPIVGTQDDDELETYDYE